MNTSAAHNRLLIVDDQQVIHDAFTKVFSSTAAPSDQKLDDLEAALFGSAPAEPENKIAFRVDHAYQGQEGLAKIEAARETNEPFSVAFVDMRMPPGWDGLETISRLLNADPELQVVMCTAYSDYTWNQVLERLGCTDRLLLLKKPFATEEAFQLAIALSEKNRLLRDARRQLAELQTSHNLLQQEITQRRHTQELLARAATHDSLTELPNRALFIERLADSLAERDPAQQVIDAVLFFDLDNFKTINDLQGHVVGDQLLAQVAARLRTGYRSEDHDNAVELLAGEALLPARLGGDEFVVLLRRLPSFHQAVAIGQRLLAILKEPFEIDGQQLIITTSIGIAQVDSFAASPDDVLRNADIAMYQAKMAGKDQIIVFDALMHQSVVRKLELESALCSAIERNELRLDYQPIHDAKSRRLIGFEALLRWRREDGSEISPAEFIPVAEESRLIVPIGEWVIETACQQLYAWRTELAPAAPPRLSVNVSKRQLGRTDFLEGFARVLDKYPGVSQFLNVEVTESTVMSDPEIIVNVLAQLRAWGVKIHMDDFGTGHSSLSCLHRFPIDVLKIDRSFVMTMDSNPDYEAIIHAIISLAHHLEVKVVAEGVETEPQLIALQDLGCEYAQGYYFSRALRALAATAWIEEYFTPAAPTLASC